MIRAKIKKVNPASTQSLVNCIIKGIHEKKGLETVVLDLAKINSTICDSFVICQGTSRTHVVALAESVEEIVRREIGITPRRREGFTNGEWVLLDYLDVVVHVFQEPIRKFYNLEALWADAPRLQVEGH